jgi:L-iditol 2-dehydrogenase
MLAALYNGQKRFELKEIDTPKPETGGMLVKVSYCAICGTDLKILNGQDVKIENGKQRFMKLPRITGHEISGTVAELGEGTKGYEIGQKVIVFPTVPCNQCYYCKAGYKEMCSHAEVVGYDVDGGFAEYVSVGKNIVDSCCILKVPDGVDMKSAAIVEPMSCAVNCFEITPVHEGATVVVIGGGPLGSLLSEMAKVKGAEKIILIEQSPDQLEIAKVTPAGYLLMNKGDETVKEVMDLTDGLGADLVITACPAPAAQVQALSIVGKKGKINFFGGLPRNNSVVPLDTNLIHYKECMVAGTHGSRAEQAQYALELFRTKIDSLKYITQIFDLKDINEAFENSFKDKRMKILIKP